MVWGLDWNDSWVGVFEKGMTYVALSRGVDIHRMRVQGFNRRSIMPDDVYVVGFGVDL